MRVIHTVHNPLCAKQFVEPVVQALRDAGMDAQIWVQQSPRYRSILEKIFVPHWIQSVSISINPIASIHRLWALSRALYASKPEIVHAHFSAGATLPLLAAWGCGVPLRIYQCHGFAYLGYRGPIRWLLRAREKLHVWLATHIVTVSHSNLAAIREDHLLGSRPGFCFAEGSAAGIDCTAFQAPDVGPQARTAFREHHRIGNAAFVVTYVGRPVARKGFHDLLHAWHIFQQTAPLAQLVIAGCSREDAEKARLPLAASVIFLNFVEDLRPLYAASDVVVLPSHHEGFGYALLEGAAAGAALIGTDIPGISCAIQEGTTGFLTPVGDRSALASCIERLADDRELCRTFGRKARERAFDCFSRDRVLEAILAFYQTLRPDFRE